MARLSQVFVPRDRLYFDLFEEAGGNIVRAADMLDQLLRAYPDNREELTRDILGRTDGVEPYRSGLVHSQG